MMKNPRLIDFNRDYIINRVNRGVNAINLQP